MKIEKALIRIIELLEERLPEPIITKTLDLNQLFLENPNLKIFEAEEDFELELPEYTIDTDLEKMFKNDAAEITFDEDDMQDWLEEMKYIISRESYDDFNPYEEEYFYVILDDPDNEDGIFRLLNRNEHDKAVIDGLYFECQEELWDEIEDNPDYMFTEAEIKEKHSYLWPMRLNVDHGY